MTGLDGLLLGLMVGLAMGTSLAVWVDRLDRADDRADDRAKPEERPPSARRDGIWWIDGQPTVGVEMHPNADEWPAYTRN